MHKFKRYWPLFALILIALLAAIAVSYGTGRKVYSMMHIFMGLFFCQFAMLKVFNPSGFAEGFQKYDFLAKRSKNYALAYPFIELALGLSYLSFINPFAVYSVTIVLMGIGAVGVIKALREGLEVRCACMGTVLDVPLSTVTLAEDVGMGLMALFMLWAV
ncbi:MAG: hypothetical protein A3E80_02680 [Chlamydiae bacterium RIFCSPHIGHO2_12_FULL_49_9]|nr:MAG: hypothetical protein A3E80_02680 [Chlamydiae bacterium RIFCSPHIGHO2_12_FULL_49_9]